MKSIKYVAILFLFSTFAIFAQNEKKAEPRNESWTTSASKLVDAFAVKVTLNDDQKEDLREVLYEYHEEMLEEKHEAEDEILEEQAENDNEEVAEEAADYEEEVVDLREWLNDEIADILEDTQVEQWNTYQADFWVEIDSSINTLKKEHHKKETH